VIHLDAATVLLQWATGGLFFLWITTRHRQVGIGYGWLLRGVYAVMAVGAWAAGAAVDPAPVRDVASALVAVATLVALVVSVVRRRAGVSGERAREEARTARVTAMTGIDRPPSAQDEDVPEFPPALDLIAPAIGAVGLVAAGVGAGGPDVLAVVRTLVGAAFLGSISDAMLLGHWYLVQPGLTREPLNELVRWVMWVWPFEVAALLWPTGMLSVLSGSVDDGWKGTLGWFWVACAVTTIVLAVVTRAALKERAYSAVMAATGLLYLAILTAFGTDLVARAVLSSG
jgi:heme exporter protein D